MSDNHYPSLTRGTLFQDDDGIWCVIDRHQANLLTDDNQIEIEAIGVHGRLNIVGYRQDLHEHDLDHKGGVEVIDTNALFADYTTETI